MSRTIRAMQLANQRPDTSEDIRDRARRRAASDHAVADRKLNYPNLNGDNFDEASNYQESRYNWHYRDLREKDGLR